MTDATLQIALDALSEGRVMEATKILTEYEELDRALSVLARHRPAGPVVGDILCESWGYDQTNINWYQVVSTTKAGKVRIREVASTQVADHEFTVEVAPVPGHFVDAYATLEAERPVKLYGRDACRATNGALKTVRPGQCSVGYSVKISSYSSARLWDGTPASETGAMYGH